MQNCLLVGMRPGNRRPLETRTIACHSAELVVPDPPQHLIRSFQPLEIGRWALGQGFLLRGGKRFVGRDEAAADEEDIARLEFYVLLGNDRFEVGEFDADGLQRFDFDGIAGCPFCVIKEDAAANDAAVFDDNCC